MIDFDKPLQTRCGYPVTIYTRNARGPEPVQGAYFCDGEDVPASWDADGNYYRHDYLSEYTLVNTPEEFEFTGYVGVHRDINGKLMPYRYVYPTYPTGFAAVIPVTIKGKVGDGIK